MFAMPQRGTSMTVEAVDEAYQIEMTGMLNQTGRTEFVVGWYHSHPGWDVWLSGVDQATQEVRKHQQEPSCSANRAPH